MLLITGDDPAFAPGNGAFLDFAAASRKDVLRFAYVFQRQQQPLCQALLPGGQAAPPPQVRTATRTRSGSEPRCERTLSPLPPLTGGDPGEAEPRREGHVPPGERRLERQRGG